VIFRSNINLETATALGLTIPGTVLAPADDLIEWCLLPFISSGNVKVFGPGAMSKIGLVASLNRPGGNLTGITNLNVEVGPKRLELVRELIPAATIIALLVNPTSPSIAEGFLRALQPAARALGLQLHVLNASTDRDFDPVFATMVQLRADALVISPDTFFNTRIERLAMLSLHHAVPAIYQYRPFVAAGGVIGYGSDETEYYRLVGIYAGKVLKGEKPADLPVVQSTKVELIINLKTAKALGLSVPLSLLGRADEVIE
jgi:ABC-type uncharacterized transport system substrate-binding protein